MVGEKEKQGNHLRAASFQSRVKSGMTRMNTKLPTRKPVLALFEWHHLGDSVLALPYVRAAELQYEVHVFCRPEAAEIFHFILPESRVHGCEPHWCTGGMLSSLQSLGDCRSILEQIRSVAPDVAVCAWSDPRVFSLMARAGIARRVGFPVTKQNYFTWEVALEKSRLMQARLYSLLATLFHGRALLTEKVNRVDYHQGHWEDWRQLGEATDVPVSMQLPWFVPQIPLSAEIASCIAKIKSDGRKVWLVHPGARLAVKRWPSARFSKLAAARLKSGGAAVLMIDPPDGNVVSEGIPSDYRFRAASPGVLAALIHASDAVLCHDSFPAHLAAALGKPVVTLFGDMPDCWFAPYGNREFVVKTHNKERLATRKGLEKRGATLLDAVTVESVLEAMSRVEKQKWRHEEAP